MGTACAIVLLALQMCLMAHCAELQARTLFLPKSTYTYTSDEWAKIVKNLQPKMDSQNAAPIRQPSTSGKVANKISAFIVGGADAALGQFPWQVALRVDNSWLCGGSLIMANWVLTAAHCAGKTYVVTLGSINRKTFSVGGIQVTSKESYPHEWYDDYNLYNDVALIKLPQEVTLTDNLKPVALPKPSDAATTFVGTVATVSGFGLTSDGGSTSNTLKFVPATVVSNAECAQFFGAETILSSTICTQQLDQATCQGDSGGPLVYQDSTNTWVQIGVVSFGSDTGCLDGPSGFARVSSFLGWISGKIYGNGTTVTKKPTTPKPTRPTTTTLPPICSKRNFKDMGNCCGSPVLNFVVEDKVSKYCKFQANVSMNIFNTFILNKFQDEANNTLDWNGAKIKKALADEACMVNCYFGSTGVISSNGTIDATAMASLLSKTQIASSSQSALVEAAVLQCSDQILSQTTPNFSRGRLSCDGTASVILQCVQFSAIAMCTNQKTDAKCAKQYSAFNYCAANILNSAELKTRISNSLAGKKIVG